MKKEVFTALDKFAKPGAMLASNTSYLNINEIAQATKPPGGRARHAFLQPGECDAAVRDRAGGKDRAGCADHGGRGGAQDRQGAGGGRRLRRLRRQPHAGAARQQAERLLLEGALPQQVDAVVTEFGLPMGPFAMGDLAGLDIGWRSRKARGIKSEIADALCEAGRFGQKTGNGYYHYEAGSRAPLPDPEVEQLIDETLQRLGASAASSATRKSSSA